MKYRLLLVSILLMSSFPVFSQADFYEKNWSKVYQFEIKELPKSALEATDTIYRRARREKNIEQFTKVLLYQSKFALILNQNAEVQIVARLLKESAASTAPQKNILESIIAKIYWEYYQNNRAKYYQRSRTSDMVNSDFRTWDVYTMFKEIHRHLQRSLQDEEVLMKTSLASINDIIIEATNSQLYRPTVYDLLAFSAIDFYKTTEYNVPQAMRDFHLKDSSYFSSFETITLPSPDTSSLELNALILYQKLLRLHNGKDTTAYLDTELQRLSFLMKLSTASDMRKPYENALRRLSAVFKESPSSTLADFEYASFLYQSGFRYNGKEQAPSQKKEAVRLCDKAIKAFPKSYGAERCAILRSKIQECDIDIEAEKYIPINKPSYVRIEYANVKSIAFQVYPMSREFFQRFRIQNDSTMLASLQAIPFIAQWKTELQDLQDYMQHSTEVSIPALAGGTYLVFSEVTARFPENNKPVFAYAFITASNLALIESEFRGHGRFQVVDRNTGKPLGGATVRLVADSTLNQASTDEELTSDKEGFVEIKRSAGYINDIKATVTYHGDRLQMDDYDLYPHYDRRDDASDYSARVFLFTDRSIYRPGQTVFFKGILLKVKDEKSTLVVNEWVTLELRDVNNKEVNSLRLRTNAFGSFTGEFKLPASGLTGEYTLSADEDYETDSKFYDAMADFEDGEIEISVEEYKRPTFEASFKPVTQTFRPNEEVTVSGSAVAFNGSKISRAKVSYRVKRTANFPYWDWRLPRYYSEDEEIAKGDTLTSNEGEFHITFTAIPDEKANTNYKPVFHYEVNVDITDLNGETRSATVTVKVAYHTLQLALNGPASITRTATTFNVISENINDQYIPSKGSVTIYKLNGPSAPVRRRPWPAPDLPSMSEEDFKKLFPHDTYGDEADQRNWKKGKKMFTGSFDTEKSKDIRFAPDASWATGAYVAEVSAIAPSGDSVTVEHRFAVQSRGKNDVGDNQLLFVETDKPYYAIGDAVRLRLASSSPDLTVMVYIDRDYEIVKTHVVHLEGNTKEISIPVGENMRDGFAIHCSAVQYNAFITYKKVIAVKKPENKLDIETITFKDKLLPGTKQTWSFEIKGKNSEQAEAEVLASMYDASLDQFKPHEWHFDPNPPHYYDNYTRLSAEKTFVTDHFRVENNRRRYLNFPPRSYDAIDWFGFSITNNYRIQSEYKSRLYYMTNPDHPSQVKMMRNRKLVDGMISGTVTDHDGAPLPGTTVIVKGKNYGAITDAEGRYEVHTQKGDTLVFTFIGYNKAEAPVGKKNRVDVVMEEDMAALGEVVVVGYGMAVQKKELTGSVTMVQSEVLGGDFFLAEAANGTGGVHVWGEAGSAKRIVIRGTSTKDGDDALYVVDGVVVTNYKLTKSDIDNISILTGANATALYGSSASNGVVIITTKSGQKKLDDEMAKVTARRNFNETAFFFPQLRTNEEGRVRFTFTTPESVTRWKLQLLAHTKNLAVGNKVMQVITQKDLMVTPNAPRFLRVGDQIIFSTKITNLTTQLREGNIALQLTNAVNGQPIDVMLGNNIRHQAFRVEGKANTEISWKLKIPSGVDAVQYKVVAKTGKFSDGEQNAIPVLSNRMLVTESIPMYARAGQTKTYNLEKLASSNAGSSTLEHHQFTVEVTSNPVWYAIQSMPYLMEFPHECAEQLFSRYYSNALASHLVNSNPKVKAVLDQWKSSGELMSNLEKNQELKSIIIEETPWLRDAENETEQKKRIALLFDVNKMADQMSSAISKLEEMQFSNGGFPWFSGGDHASRYITQHVVSGVGHLKHLNVKGTNNNELNSITTNAIKFLDETIVKDYEDILKDAELAKTKAATPQAGERAAKTVLEEHRVFRDQVHYLYMKTFFPDSAISSKRKSAMEYFLTQSGKFWKEQKLYTKTMIALIHYRHGNIKLASDILLSIKENAVVGDDMGMYWRENKAGWYWDEAPIETQALLIGAFTEIESQDKNLSHEERTKCIDEMRIWLLKNKQTTRWKTTKATTEAIYALMLQGSDWMSIDKVVDVSVGGNTIISRSVEAGTGYLKKTWLASEIKPSMSSVTLTHKGEGIAWGGMYWQYFEDLDKITGAETPLRLTKKVFLVQRSDAGEVLTEINRGTAVKVGDRIRVRIELTASQTMEFLHMKDMRASGLEPIDVLSGYKWQDGLGYYQSTKDASTNFFFDHVREGVYVFEYDLRANNKGDFANGITTIQSMYAPEFSSHSEGVRIVIE